MCINENRKHTFTCLVQIVCGMNPHSDDTLSCIFSILWPMLVQHIGLYWHIHMVNNQKVNSVTNIQMLSLKVTYCQWTKYIKSCRQDNHYAIGIFHHHTCLCRLLPLESILSAYPLTHTISVYLLTLVFLSDTSFVRCSPQLCH